MIGQWEPRLANLDEDEPLSPPVHSSVPVEVGSQATRLGSGGVWVGGGYDELRMHVLPALVARE